jgi:hypothetical protein
MHERLNRLWGIFQECLSLLAKTTKLLTPTLGIRLIEFGLILDGPTSTPMHTSFPVIFPERLLVLTLLTLHIFLVVCLGGQVAGYYTA